MPDLDREPRPSPLEDLARLDPEDQAIAAARSGVVVAVLVLLGYAIQLGVAYAVAESRDLRLLISDLGSLILAFVLVQRIWTRQSLWAALLATLFFGAELVAAFTGPTTAAGGALIVMFAALTASALVGTAAALRLKAVRAGGDRDSAADFIVSTVEPRPGAGQASDLPAQ